MRPKKQFLFPLRGQKGSLLVVSLWMISILTILSISIGYHVRQKISLADRIDRRNWLYGLAEGGVYKSLYRIREEKEADSGYHTLNDSHTSGEGVFLNMPLGGGAYTVSYENRDLANGTVKVLYGVEDEEGKININVVDAKIISQLFKVAAGTDEDLAGEIAYSIVDWRDSDNSLSHPDYGAEDDYYEDLDTPYGCKDHLFESLDELLLVRGVTPELFEKIKPYVTIYGGGTVNVNTAPKLVLRGLGMDESLADKIIEYRAGPDGEEGTTDDGVFMQAANIAYNLDRQKGISSSDQSIISQLTSTDRLGILSNNFRIKSRGEVRQKQQTLELDVVVDWDGKILSWFSGMPRRMTPFELDSIDRKANSRG